MRGQDMSRKSPEVGKKTVRQKVYRVSVERFTCRQLRKKF